MDSGKSKDSCCSFGFSWSFSAIYSSKWTLDNFFPVSGWRKLCQHSNWNYINFTQHFFGELIFMILTLPICKKKTHLSFIQNSFYIFQTHFKVFFRCHAFTTIFIFINYTDSFCHLKTEYFLSFLSLYEKQHREKLLIFVYLPYI